MTANGPVTVTLGVINVAVDASDAAITDAFRDLYHPALGEDPGRPTIGLTVRKRRTLLGAVYDIHGEGELLTKGCRREEVIPHLEWGVNRRLVETSSPYVVVHAASLARGEAGVALVAPSGSGKSTLALALVRRGWRYLCDEFALIDTARGWLHPYPKAICLKAGAFSCARQLGVNPAGAPRYVKACKGEVAYVRPGDIREDAVADTVPLRLIVCPTYVACDDPRVRPMSPARAAFHLAANTMNPGVLGPQLMPRLASWCEEVPAFTLESGDLEATCGEIDALVDRLPLAALAAMAA